MSQSWKTVKWCGFQQNTYQFPCHHLSIMKFLFQSFKIPYGDSVIITWANFNSNIFMECNEVCTNDILELFNGWISDTCQSISSKHKTSKLKNLICSYDSVLKQLKLETMDIRFRQSSAQYLYSLWESGLTYDILSNIPINSEFNFLYR